MYSQYLGIKPTTFALLTQCSTTEPQEHMFNLRPFIFSIFTGSALKYQSVRFLEMYKLKHVYGHYGDEDDLFGGDITLL